MFPWHKRHFGSHRANSQPVEILTSLALKFTLLGGKERSGPDHNKVIGIPERYMSPGAQITKNGKDET